LREFAGLMAWSLRLPRATLCRVHWRASQRPQPYWPALGCREPLACALTRAATAIASLPLTMAGQQRRAAASEEEMIYAGNYAILAPAPTTHDPRPRAPDALTPD
jgi:hypothetical protein